MHQQGNEVPRDCTDVKLPYGLLRPRFLDGKWVEGASKEEIEEFTRPRERPLSDIEIVGQQSTDHEISDMSQWQNITELEIQAMEHGQNITELEIQSMEQGQKITDMEIEQMMQGQAQTDQELRLLELEAKLNV